MLAHPAMQVQPAVLVLKVTPAPVAMVVPLAGPPRVVAAAVEDHRVEVLVMLVHLAAAAVVALAAAALFQAVQVDLEARQATRPFQQEKAAVAVAAVAVVLQPGPLVVEV
jgi:hypothetical protein